MHRSHRSVLLVALVLLSVASLRAQPAADFSGHWAGHWEGTVQAPGMAVNIELDLVKNSQGELAGTFANLSQKLKGLLLANVAVKGSSVSFQIKGTPGERTFQGALSADGRSMSGDYTQGGHTMPFTLTRTGDARIEAPARSAPIGKELEGTWNGTLDVEGTQRRLVLTMSNQPDGTATGSFFSVDEGLDIPIATITQRASNVIIDVKVVGGSYSAVLNPEGSELAGTWTQRGVDLPLNFRRAKP